MQTAAAHRVTWLLRLLWPTRSPLPRVTAWLWIGLGAANLIAATADAIIRSYNQEDLTEVLSWLQHWTTTGTSPYTSSALAVDYPPYALLVLQWIGWLPANHVYWLYALINAACVVAACWHLTRWLLELNDEPFSAREAVALTGMMLATRAVRFSLRWGQTTPFALLLFAVTMRFAPRRPWVAGVLFALASYKLNLAAGFGVLLVMSGSWLTLAVAAGVAVALTSAFALSIGQPLLVVLSSYVTGVASIYGGAGFLQGSTGFRTLLMESTGNYDVVQVLYPVLAVGLLLVVARLAPRAAHSGRGRALTAATCLLWCLVSLTHQRYSALLLLPAMWLLVPRTSYVGDRRWTSWVLPALGLFYLVRAVPVFVEEWLVAFGGQVSPAGAASVATSLELLQQHGLRVLALSLFGGAVYSLATSAAPRQPACLPPANVPESSS